MGKVTASTGASKTMWQVVAVRVLDVSERGVRGMRRFADSTMDRLQLRLHVWRLAADPDTRRWIEETRRSLADGDAKHDEVTRDELLELMEERRRRIS